MEGSLSFIVLCTNGHFALEESPNHHILAIVTGHVEWSTAMTVDRIRLREEGMEGGGGTVSCVPPIAPFRKLGFYHHIHVYSIHMYILASVLMFFHVNKLSIPYHTNKILVQNVYTCVYMYT